MSPSLSVCLCSFSPQEYIVNITKPLGVVVEESADEERMAYVVEVGEKAAGLGVEVGDVVVAVSFVFGDDFLRDVEGKGVEAVQSLIKSREEDYVLLRLRKGMLWCEGLSSRVGLIGPRRMISPAATGHGLPHLRTPPSR